MVGPLWDRDESWRKSIRQVELRYAGDSSTASYRLSGSVYPGSPNGRSVERRRQHG